MSRIILASPRPSKRARLPSTWICTLPEEITFRIAQYATGCQQNDDALHIAESSPSLHKAILSTLSYKFIVPTLNVDRWARIFTGSIQEMWIISPSHGAMLPNVSNLLKSPTLLSAHIWEHSTFLRPLSQARSLRKLQIHLDKDQTLLLQTLAVHNLTHLELLCTHGQDSSCKRKCILANPTPGLLKSRCPNLESLEVDSNCINLCNLISVISNLKHLRRLSLSIPRDCDISDYDVQVLKQVPIVELFAAPDLGIIAPKLGSAVTALHPWPPLTGTQLRQVALNCSNLRTLNIDLDSETEAVLADCVADMKSLDYLAIEYCHEHDPTPGKLLQIVQAAPNLTGLDIGSIEVPLGELLDIVKVLGVRLRFLSTSHSEQDERDCQSVALLLETLSMHNPNIVKLHMFTAGVNLSCFNGCREEWLKWRRRIAMAQRTLQRWAPHLDHEHIDDVAEKVCGMWETGLGCEGGEVQFVQKMMLA